jgi:hypothetical protein
MNEREGYEDVENLFDFCWFVGAGVVVDRFTVMVWGFGESFCVFLLEN